MLDALSKSKIVAKRVVAWVTGPNWPKYVAHYEWPARAERLRTRALTVKDGDGQLAQLLDRIAATLEACAKAHEALEAYAKTRSERLS
jgi:hypothetical protein